jgi:hypothetical protein
MPKIKSPALDAKVGSAKKAVARKSVATKTAIKTSAKQVVVKKAAVKKAPVKKTAPEAKRLIKAPAVKKAAAVKPVKVEKVKLKLVRDSFTMPQEDWALIQQLKERALGFKRPAKKSELLRAGLQALITLTDEQLGVALGKLVTLKPGRPKAK